MDFKNLTDRKLAYSLEILGDSIKYGKNWDEEKRQTLALHVYAISDTLLARSQKPEARSQNIMMNSFITI